MWRIGRRWKNVLNNDFIEIEGESCGDMRVEGRMM